MATRMNNNLRPVFAANAIARIRDITGAEQVDVVSHSKGGIFAPVVHVQPCRHELGTRRLRQRGH